MWSMLSAKLSRTASQHPQRRRRNLMASLLRPIRAYCLECTCNQPPEVRECPSVQCALHPYRLNKQPKFGRKPLLKVIRAKCMDCTGHFEPEITDCTATDCPLWNYRKGVKPPSERRKMSDAQRAAFADRMARTRRINSAASNHGQDAFFGDE